MGGFVQIQAALFQFSRVDQRHSKLSAVTDKNDVHYIRLREADYANVWGSEWTKYKSSEPYEFWRMHQRKPEGQNASAEYPVAGPHAYSHCLGWMTFSKFEHRKHPFRYQY